MISPLLDDGHAIVADPFLKTDQKDVVLPRWNGSAFLSGNTSIRQEFLRLVDLYGKIPTDSPAGGKAEPALAPADDILGRLRGVQPAVGAYENHPSPVTGAELTADELHVEERP